MAIAPLRAPQVPTFQTGTHTIGTTATKVLDRNKRRILYRVKAALTNTDNIYHGPNNRVSTSSLDIIPPGGVLDDSGEWETIYRSEVWLISGTADQSVEVEEMVKE